MKSDISVHQHEPSSHLRAKRERLANEATLHTSLPPPDFRYYLHLTTSFRSYWARPVQVRTPFLLTYLRVDLTTTSVTGNGKRSHLRPDARHSHTFEHCRRPYLMECETGCDNTNVQTRMQHTCRGTQSSTPKILGYADSVPSTPYVQPACK